MRAYVRTWVSRITTQRAQQLEEGKAGSLHPAMVKVLTTEATRERTEVILHLMGPAGMLHADDGYRFERPTTAGMRGDDPREHFLRARAGTIEGGTSEVLRNVLGERVLDLAREARSDLGVPWRDTRRP